jgi:hypothetical protein
MLLSDLLSSKDDSKTWASCTELVLCARELFAAMCDHRRSAAAFKLRGVCGRWEIPDAMAIGSTNHDYECLIWRRLTPELSRAATRLGVMVNATI